MQQGTPKSPLLLLITPTMNIFKKRKKWYFVIDDWNSGLIARSFPERTAEKLILDYKPEVKKKDIIFLFGPRTNDIIQGKIELAYPSPAVGPCKEKFIIVYSIVQILNKQTCVRDTCEEVSRAIAEWGDTNNAKRKA